MCVLKNKIKKNLGLMNEVVHAAKGPERNAVLREQREVAVARVRGERVREQVARRGDHRGRAPSRAHAKGSVTNGHKRERKVNFITFFLLKMIILIKLLKLKFLIV